MDSDTSGCQLKSCDAETASVMRLPETSGVSLDHRPVPLEPFGHQVAGQASMLMVDPGTLCKPLIPREHHLYCTLPASLRPFTPRYYGVLYVHLEEREDGSLNLWGRYPDTEDNELRVDNSTVIRPPVDREDAGNKERNRENRNVLKGPSPRLEVENSGSLGNNIDLENSVDREQNIGQTLEASPLKDPTRSMGNGKIPSSAHKNSEDSVDVKADSLPSSGGFLRTGKDHITQDVDKRHVDSDLLQPCADDMKQDIDKVDGGRHQRQGVNEEVDSLQPLPSGFSSGTSTPMSSGSEQDLPSAVDGAPLPFRPSSRCVVRVTEDGVYEVMGGRAEDNKFLTTTDDQVLSQTSTDPNPGSDVTIQPLNPWGLSLHTRLLDKMRKSQPSLSGCPFLVLENVVARFARPCILDLKVGSRLHGDDASPKKMASQSRKCNMTTSRSLGLRLCGMQVYQESTGTYKSLDKYHGRTLTDETFYEVLRDFLHNGQELRCELLLPILARLHALVDCLNDLHSFRFYASSLLIMYDGLSSRSAHLLADQQNSQVCVPASTMGGSDQRGHLSEPPRERKVKGVHAPSPTSEQGTKQVSSKQERELTSHSGRENSDTSAQLNGQRGRQTDGIVQPSVASASKSAGSFKEGDASYDLDPDNGSTWNNMVDVRMIDFAHTTHSGFHDNVVHEGPDRDYIWGLQNLTRMFTQLHRETS